MPEISVILPVYRTAPALVELSRRLKSTLEALGTSFELVFVNDGDASAWPILRELAGADNRIRVLNLTRNFGQHPATAAGLHHAAGEIIVMMDTDLQDRPEDLPRLLAALDDDDIDVVYTACRDEASAFLTRLTSRLFHWVFSLAARVDVPRGIGTYRAFRRNVLDALESYAERGIVYGPLMFFVGFNSSVISVARAERPVGISAYTFYKRVSLAASLLLSYTDLPYKVTLYSGLAMLGGSFVYSIGLVVQYALFGRLLPPGLATLTLLMTVFAGMMMLSLGSLGAYVYRIYQEVLARPRYVISRRLNIAERGQEEHADARRRAA